MPCGVRTDGCAPPGIWSTSAQPRSRRIWKCSSRRALSAWDASATSTIWSGRTRVTPGPTSRSPQRSPWDGSPPTNDASSRFTATRTRSTRCTNTSAANGWARRSTSGAAAGGGPPARRGGCAPVVAGAGRHRTSPTALKGTASAAYGNRAARCGGLRADASADHEDAEDSPQRARSERVDCTPRRDTRDRLSARPNSASLCLSG